ncbi:hypothetical protein BDR05DRAFT_945381 [Suillus weaverae]|nr:hypothetical protein BDR05DRAFT_945381 [Suillus weaverae]
MMPELVCTHTDSAVVMMLAASIGTKLKWHCTCAFSELLATQRRFHIIHNLTSTLLLHILRRRQGFANNTHTFFFTKVRLRQQHAHFSLPKGRLLSSHIFSITGEASPTTHTCFSLPKYTRGPHNTVTYTRLRWAAKRDNVPIGTGYPMWAHANNCTMIHEWAEVIEYGWADMRVPIWHGWAEASYWRNWPDTGVGRMDV